MTQVAGPQEFANSLTQKLIESLSEDGIEVSPDAREKLQEFLLQGVERDLEKADDGFSRVVETIKRNALKSNIREFTSGNFFKIRDWICPSYPWCPK